MAPHHITPVRVPTRMYAVKGERAEPCPLPANRRRDGAGRDTGPHPCGAYSVFAGLLRDEPVVR